jgi:hypothetical protein
MCVRYPGRPILRMDRLALKALEDQVIGTTPVNDKALFSIATHSAVRRSRKSYRSCKLVRLRRAGLHGRCRLQQNP